MTYFTPIQQQDQDDDEQRKMNETNLLITFRFLVFITAVEAFSDQIHKHLLCVYMFKLVNIIDYAFFDILYVLYMFFFICHDLVPLSEGRTYLQHIISGPLRIST
ncbi:hypothetical protein ACJX0J_036547, partial [Zea mays]